MEKFIWICPGNAVLAASEPMLVAAIIPTAKLMLFVQCCVVILNTDPTPRSSVLQLPEHI